MKKNIILIIVIILNFMLIGVIIYQNNYINTNFKEIEKKIETLSVSNNQQDIQINQLTNKQIKTGQEQSLKDLENGTDESIFENTPTDGLEPITENEAKKLWENYLTDTLLEDINEYNFIEIQTVMVKPTNRFTAGSESNVRTANFERSAYLFKYKQKDNLGEVIGYVDTYSGKIIGGYYSGD